MQVSFDELRRIYRLEKNTSNLVEVEEDFFNALNEFIKIEKQRYLESLKKDFNESSARDFTNLKKIVEELFSLREKKLLNKALTASRTNELNETHMSLQEKEMYRKLIKVLNNYNELLVEIFNGEAEKNDSKRKDLNNLSIRMISDVPSFVGTDMNEYGPFKKGETVSLPFNIAKLFLSRNLGEKI